jgi:hypothetical protein
MESQMRRFPLMLALVAYAGFAHAGVYSDDMAKCLVASTSQKDKVALVRWIFANAALHPDVASISRVSSTERETLDRGAAALLEKLLTESCRKQTEDAIRYEGPMAFQLSFQVLGQVAMKELMSNKDVAAGFQGFAKYVDAKKIEALGKQ